jgi:hypothetical protein
MNIEEIEKELELARHAQATARATLIAFLNTGNQDEALHRELNEELKKAEFKTSNLTDKYNSKTDAMNRARLRWAPLFHPILKRAFREHRAYIKTMGGFMSDRWETGEHGWHTFATNSPKPANTKVEKCASCGQKIYELTWDKNRLRMPGIARCARHTCGATICWQCMNKTDSLPPDHPMSLLEAAQHEVEVQRLAASGLQFGTCPICGYNYFDPIIRR